MLTLLEGGIWYHYFISLVKGGDRNTNIIDYSSNMRCTGETVGGAVCVCVATMAQVLICAGLVEN